jgi:glycosyltransferase involved in cell wall biosynthesis
MELTVLMPCLNEAETLATCVGKAKKWISEAGIEAEVLIADNGSTDGSQTIARELGARVIEVEEKGYGAALFAGATEARGKYIVMGDSDDSYDFSKLDPFLEKLRNGADLVMGNRFAGGIAPGAMPWKNKYIGNPALSFIGRSLFGIKAKDFHCGLRGFSKEAFHKMDLRTTGMEFASEMVIKSQLLGLHVSEVPTTLSKDGRSRPPHLKPWRDGWRHLRFMVSLSPKWAMLIPGLILLLVSTGIYVPLLFGPISLGFVELGMNTLFMSQAGMLLGFATLIFGTLIRIFGVREGLLPHNKLTLWAKNTPIFEIGMVAGLVVFCAGLALALNYLSAWAREGFGLLTYGEFISGLSLSSTLLLLGGMGFSASVAFGFLSLPTRR